VYLKVSKTHEIYYEESGTPGGLPCVFVHGGPGAGFTEADAQLFSPQRHRIILFDQRGAGRSRPFASLEENRPGHHVGDITRLLDHLNVDRAVFAGGSWGSLLSLLYAIDRPERVHALVLWGVFLGTREECDFYMRGGVKTHYPDLWERFTALVPEKNRNDPAPYYFEKLCHGSDMEKEKYAREWAYYETAISQLEYSDERTRMELETFSYRSLAPLECYYNINNFFLKENFVLKNAMALSGIPMYLHHGRFDFVCPPSGVYALKKSLRHARLAFHLAGHAYQGTEMARAIKDTLADLDH